jgi:hypothetical protein
MDPALSLPSARPPPACAVPIGGGTAPHWHRPKKFLPTISSNKSGPPNPHPAVKNKPTLNGISNTVHPGVDGIWFAVHLVWPLSTPRGRASPPAPAPAASEGPFAAACTRQRRRPPRGRSRRPAPKACAADPWNGEAARGRRRSFSLAWNALNAPRELWPVALSVQTPCGLGPDGRKIIHEPIPPPTWTPRLLPLRPLHASPVRRRHQAVLVPEQARG